MGHFKRVGRSVTKQTYRIPPRTTVAGMLAAIVGSDRDSYYDVFGADTSAIAITPLFDIRTVNVPTTGLGTDPKQAVTKTAGVDGVTHSHIRIRRATDKYTRTSCSPIRYIVST